MVQKETNGFSKDTLVVTLILLSANTGTAIQLWSCIISHQTEGNSLSCLVSICLSFDMHQLWIWNNGEDRFYETQFSHLLPRNGLFCFLAQLIASIFPSVPRTPNPPGTNTPLYGGRTESWSQFISSNTMICVFFFFWCAHLALRNTC